jgi:hypothetical protein
MADNNNIFDPNLTTYKNRVLEFIAKRTSTNRIEEKYVSSGPPHYPMFVCTLSFSSDDRDLPVTAKAEGKATTKSMAMHLAYRELWSLIRVCRVMRQEPWTPVKEIVTVQEPPTSDQILKRVRNELNDIGRSALAADNNVRIVIQMLLIAAGVEPNPGPRAPHFLPENPLFYQVPTPSEAELTAMEDGLFLATFVEPILQSMDFDDAAWPSLGPSEEDERDRIEAALIMAGIETHPGPKGKQQEKKMERKVENKVRQDLKAQRPKTKAVRPRTIKREVAKFVARDLRPTNMDRQLAKASHRRAVSNISASLPPSLGITQDLDTSRMPPVQRVLWSLTAPKECPPVRFCDEYSTVETSLANPYSVEIAPWNASGSTTTVPWLSNNDLFTCIFRCAERGSVQYVNNAGGYTYSIYGKNLITSNNVPSVNFTQLGDFAPGRPTPIPIAYCKSAGTNGPHSQVMFCGTADGLQSDPRRFILLNQGDTFEIAATWSGSNTVNVGLDMYTPQGIIPQAYTSTGVTGTSGLWDISITQTGYYCPSVITGAALSGFTFNWSGGKFFNTGSTTAIFAQRPVAGFDLNWNVATSIRIAAASVLYTNKAAEMYRNGFFTFLQPPKGSHWTDFISNQFIAGSGLAIKNVMGSRTAVNGEIKKGVYAFLKPTQDDDFQAHVYSQVIGGVLYDSFFPLNDKSEFMMLWLNIPYQSGTPTAQDGLLTISHGVEFEPLDTWRTRKIGTISIGNYRKAIAHLRDVPQVHENPNHLSDLWNGIMRGAKWLWNNGGSRVVQNVAKNVMSAPITNYRRINAAMNGGGGGLDLAQELMEGAVML